MTILHRLAEQGQSVWLDFIRRAFTASGELAGAGRDTLTLVTSDEVARYAGS